MKELIKQLKESNSLMGELDSEALSKIIQPAPMRVDEKDRGPAPTYQAGGLPAAPEGPGIGQGILQTLIAAATTTVAGFALLWKDFPVVVGNLMKGVLGDSVLKQPPADPRMEELRGRLRLAGFPGFTGTAPPEAGTQPMPGPGREFFAPPTIPTRPSSLPLLGLPPSLLGGKVLGDEPTHRDPTRRGGLTQHEMEELRKAMLFKESSNRYHIINNLGYAGGYQFGGMALSDIGFVKRGTSNRGLTNPNNWTGKEGIHSLEDWLGNPAVQDKAFLDYAQLNIGRLRHYGVLEYDSSPRKIAGYVAAAHLLGAKGASTSLELTDANNVKGQTYFDIGAALIDTVGPRQPTGSETLTPAPSDTRGLFFEPVSATDEGSEVVVQVIQTEKIVQVPVPVTTGSAGGSGASPSGVNVGEYHASMNAI